MKKNQRTKRILIVLFVILCAVFLADFALGKYTGQWTHGFGLIVSPVEDDDIDTSLRRYFRSNELLSASENASYTVNGTSTWFSVANALDSSTVSQDDIAYTITWYISEDGTSWTEHKSESGTFTKDTYGVKKYTVEPITLDGTLYNTVKVCAKTSSFVQETMEAVYMFNYADYSVNTAYNGGIITVDIDMNDASGEFVFGWQAGISPDNSDPTGLFKNALVGPSELTVTLEKNTKYQFLFFVTDADLLARLSASPNEADGIVTMTEK